MRGGFGGMISFNVKGGGNAAVRVAAGLRVFHRATSLGMWHPQLCPPRATETAAPGGTESLVEHRRSIEPPDTLTPASLLRLSVGIEDPADLIADLRSALEGVAKL